MLLLIAAGFAGMFLLIALLLVCRGFALQSQSHPEPYELRLWAQYAHTSPDTRKAA